jgi:hypothetical protein
MSSYTDQAAALGAEHGRNAGSWVIDGNTTVETARAILKGYEDGDPEVMDMQPAPLSGEWADSMTPDILANEVDLPINTLQEGQLEEVCDAYEQAFADSYWAEVLGAARTIA